VHPRIVERVQVIVACFGNTLRGDDGFGIAVADRLRGGEVPDGVRVLEIGIGGIHLVQELLDPIDVLLVVDAVDVGRPAGTVVVLDPEVPDVSTLTVEQRRDALADMHLATPERVFTMARGLGVLPPVTMIIGCQAADARRYGEGLTSEVAGAVAAAAAEVRRTVSDLGIRWH
jgi:hydrogenase maturation protease